MELHSHVRERRWIPVAGYGLFVALMVAGYCYNITFVQLGLIDLGTRLVGAAVTGVTMDRRGWSMNLRTKLRLLFGVVCLQFALTHVVYTSDLRIAEVFPTVAGGGTPPCTRPP